VTVGKRGTILYSQNLSPKRRTSASENKKKHTTQPNEGGNPVIGASKTGLCEIELREIKSKGFGSPSESE